jgi:transposase
VGVRCCCGRPLKHHPTRWQAISQALIPIRVGERTGNGLVFTEFLKRLMHGASRPVFLNLDDGSYYHSRPVKDYVASLSGKLRLFFLPPYSPELNRDEQVWNHVKHHGIAKAALRGGKGELRKLVVARLRSLQKLPWTIHKFFLTPDTQYVAV